MILKSNSLVDGEIIRALYRASQAGVQIDLIIRGICCLRPGIPDVSDNIRVISIVGRFLEHSRIYYFENGGDPAMYVGSADLMPRNIDRRVEVLFPIEDKDMRTAVVNDILEVYLEDTEKSYNLHADGKYIPRKSLLSESQSSFNSQAWLLHGRYPTLSPALLTYYPEIETEEE